MLKAQIFIQKEWNPGFRIFFLILRGSSEVLPLAWWFMTSKSSKISSLWIPNELTFCTVPCNNYMLLFIGFSFTCISTYIVNSSEGGNRAYTSASHNVQLSTEHIIILPTQWTTGFQLAFNKQWTEILVIWEITKQSSRKWNYVSMLARSSSVMPFKILPLHPQNSPYKRSTSVKKLTWCP